MIKVRSLSKDYGQQRAVDAFTLDLSPGTVFGFVGPNGSGKTTTLRMLATLLTPTEGDARIGGYSILSGAREIRRMIGYMPDTIGAYDDMRVHEFLSFFAAAYGISRRRLRTRMPELLERVSLKDSQRKPIASLSRGMSQRLSVARVLLHDPDVLLLDEPLSGLDPIGRADMRKLFRELQQGGKTIIISSHILTELTGMCDRIGIMNEGKLLLDSSMQDVMNRFGDQVVLHIAVGGRTLEAMVAIKELEIVQRVEPGDGILRVTLNPGSQDYAVIPETIIRAGINLLGLKREAEDLESVFLNTINDAALQSEYTSAARVVNPSANGTTTEKGSESE